MVLCLLALPLFAVLGIFSVKYRKLTLDALECLFKTVALRKCESGLDDRIRADITGTTLKYSPKLAKIVYKNYKILSWIVLILFLGSFYISSVGIYNYINYGNCNGPESAGFCIFDPTGENSKTSEIDSIAASEAIMPVLEEDDPIIGNLNARLTIIEFGCFSCSYTKKAESTVKEVLDYYKGQVNLQFKTFYIPYHNESYHAALAADCAKEQGRYLDYHTSLFELQESLGMETYLKIAENLNLDISEFKSCLISEKYKNEAYSDSLAGIHAGVIGTPTFFINGQRIIGPKPFKTFKKIIDEELKK